MKKRKLILFPLLVAALALASCKDDDEDSTSYNYVSGEVVFGTMPEYVLAGEKYNFEASGAYKDDNGPVGYYWVCTPLKTTKDTLRYENDPAGKSTKFSFTVPPDTLCNISIVVTAYAKDYVSISSSVSSTIVDPTPGTGSIRGIRFDASSPSFTDPRDGKKYLTTEIGNLIFFRQNLAWEQAGQPYARCKAMTDIYGHYYSWTEAQTACPEGWRVPSDADWREIARVYGTDPGEGFSKFESVAGKMMADASFNGKAVWTYWPAVQVTDESLFSAIPTTYATISDGVYNFKSDKYGLWWTSDSYEGMGVARYLYEDNDSLFAGTFSKEDIAAPVRCVRNK
ncbi:MAG: FISUMP domain-containing protein [Candidatus Cryptobacteroides sp.]|nr:FISUMP domain-containing protein [Candidatus Cryptobacteroides sp.]